jgi:nucleotide-binding universal stress UspA family protein
MFQSCLICTDFSDGMHRLVNFVPDLAQAGLKKIVFFNSVPLWSEGEIPRVDEERVEKVKARLNKATANVPEGVEVQIEVMSGKPLDTIPRVLQTHPVDVVFTGTPMRSFLQEKCFGSTSVGLGKLTDKPLTIIRPQLITTYTKEELSLRCQHIWRYLLIPYKEGKAARYLLDRIKQQVQEYPEGSLKKCMLISVVEEGGRTAILSQNRLQEAKENIAKAKEELEAIGLEVNTEVRQGNPIQEIMDAALEFDIGAIALATDYRNTLLEWTAPSFANDLMRRSWFPVVFYSPKK